MSKGRIDKSLYVYTSLFKRVHASGNHRMVVVCAYVWACLFVCVYFCACMCVCMHVRKSSIRWLPDWFNVEVSSHDIGSEAMVYKSTLKDHMHVSFEVTSLQWCTISLSSHATWRDAMSHVMYTQYTH